MKAKLLRILIIIVLVSSSFVFPSRVLANDSSLLLYPGGNDPDGLGSNQSTNTIFYDRTFNFSYSGGSVCLSAQDSVCTSPAIDDAVRIYVDGSQVLYQESYTHDFGPVDFSGKLHIGSNQVRIELIDLIGPTRGGSALWLVATGGGGTPNTPNKGNARATWSLSFSPSYVLEYDPNKWSVDPLTGVSMLVSNTGDNCYISQSGPIYQADLTTEAIGAITYGVAPDIIGSKGTYRGYTAINERDDQSGIQPSFIVFVAPSAPASCLADAKVVLSTLRKAGSPSQPSQNQPQPTPVVLTEPTQTGQMPTQLVPDFTDPQVDDISAQLTPEARAKWEQTATELRSRLSQADFDELVRLLYGAAHVTSCTLDVVVTVTQLLNTGVFLPSQSFVEDCGDVVAAPIESILYKLEPAQAPPSGEDSNANFIQMLWNWLKSLFGN